MSALFNKLVKRYKNKQFSILSTTKKIYIRLKTKNRKYYFYSKNGFDFSPSKNSKVKKLFKQNKSKNFDHLRHHVTPGSERLSPQDITIQSLISTDKTDLLFYHIYKNSSYQVGLIAFDKQGNISWRHSEPVWQSPRSWQGRHVVFVDLVKFKNRIISYWYLKDHSLQAVVYPAYKSDTQTQLKQKNFLHKVQQNPLIVPNSKNSWEAFTTFNPAAIYQSGKVHLLYRAQGFDYRSVLGYATSSDGQHIDFKQDYPCYIPTQPFEKAKKGRPTPPQSMSGGGREGCEDPRITRIGDRIYMTYVAFNGYDPQRIALTSIALDDFLNRRWLWQRPVLISPPGVVDKSACILPEKIGNKYVIFHRIFPNILIDFVDSLDFKPGKYLTGQYKITPRSPLWWDSRKIGVAAPPLKTKHGWLLIYQSVDDKNSGHYKVGAMLLKLNDPTQVLYRSRFPIIEPDKWYDNQGFKAGVVYPCGAVIIKNSLFVYYGGADSHVCVATAPLDNFLDNLKTTGHNRLKSVMIKRI